MDQRGREALNVAISQCIDSVKSAGSFAMTATCDTFPVPGLQVEGVGEVLVPVGESDVGALIASAEKAPFGKGQQALIDDSVRRTFQIDHSRVRFENDAWHCWLDNVVHHAVTKLGASQRTGNVRAELYKMLIYDQGAMFKVHKEYSSRLHRSEDIESTNMCLSTEKQSGMFGTLVVCLPCEHAGGQVYLRHAQEVQVFDSANASRYSVSYAAWYSDVLHEVMAWLLPYMTIY